MQNQIHDLILKATCAQKAFQIETIQPLWSGYGEIIRYGLTGGERKSVIVKHVKLTGQEGRRRGEQNTTSHRRKLRSYQVETAWYAVWSKRCDDNCRVAVCFATAALGDDVVIILEDLNAAGFSKRYSRIGLEAMSTCLHWLANFHATFIGEQPDELWPVGTYWHLDTRPDELEALQDIQLKNAAGAIDQKLRDCCYQTIVHGDAKLDNFCFSADGVSVAAVDFQYVGGGCGIKDVAYFIDSCLNNEDCQRYETKLLDIYFQALKQALKTQQKPIDAEAVEHEWRLLYPVAWTDFHRFLKGWSPGYWSSNSYSERLSRQVIAQLQP